MKRLKASVLAAILTVLTVVGGMIGLNNMTVKAANQVTLSIDTVEAAPGDKDVTVAVKVENPNKVNLGGFQLEISWDKTALQVKPDVDPEEDPDAEPVNVVEGNIKNLKGGTINRGRLSEGFINYSTASEIGTKVEAGDLLLIKFDVLDGAKEGLNSINLNLQSAASAEAQKDPTTGEVINHAPSIMDIVEVVNGGIKLPGSVTPPTPTPGTIKLSVDKVNATPGQKDVKVAVKVENSGDLAGLQFGIKYDTTALKATKAEVGDFQLSSGQVDDNVEINTEKMAEGLINYADAVATGTDKSGTVMIITFDVLDKLGESVISIDETVAAKGTDATALNVETANGSVTVTEAPACTHPKVTDADYKEVKAPTYKEDGLAEATCPDCGTKLTKPIPKLVGCKHVNVKDSDYKVTKEPTYTEEGLAEATCPDCGEVLTKKVDKKVCNHVNVKDSDYKVVKEPTIGVDGLAEATCPDCKQTVTKVLPALTRPDDSKENININVNNDIKVEVKVPANAVNNNLTDDETTAILGGADSTVNVNVNPIDGDKVSKEEKDLIQKAQENITIGAFIDINVTLQVEGFDVKTITQTASKIAFTVQIPADILNAPAGYERTFNIVRIHNGIAEMLNPTKSGDKLAFESDKFSTYAIVYSDKAVTDTTNPTEPTEQPTDTTKPNSPDTGDALPVALFVLMFVGIAGIVVSSKKRA